MCKVSRQGSRSGVEPAARLAGVCGALVAGLLSGCMSFPPQQPDFATKWLLPQAASDVPPPVTGSAAQAPHLASTARASPAATASPRTGYGANAAFLGQSEPASCTPFDSLTPQPIADADVKAYTAQRNACVDDLRQMIDAAWEPYRAKILAQVGSTDASLDAAATIASAAAGATTKVASKVLSVLSSAASGTKTAIDNDMLLKASLNNILHQMDADRDKVWAGMLVSEQDDINTYTIRRAMGDLMAYYRAGTLADGLEQLNADTSSATNSCKNAKAATADATAGAIQNAAGAPPAKTDTNKPTAETGAAKPKRVESAQSQSPGAPAATTTAQQCQQQTTNAIRALPAVIDTPDLDKSKEVIARNISKLGLTEEPRLKAIASALHISTGTTPADNTQQVWSKERQAVKVYFAQLPNQSAIDAAVQEVKAATTEDLTDG